MDDPRTALAIELLERFAVRTGVGSTGAQRRYLWTDAFAVCNWVGLARGTGDPRHLERARALVDDVHRILGRHRPDDVRSGWISGLSEEEGARHPTAGGLRIGKPLPERRPDEPFDDRLEWERDGQYFHYLTKWMHALDVVARATGDLEYERFAHELARRAHEAFVWRPPGERPRLYWKCSIDLSRPLVPSMGQHDALDGLVTTVQLAATPVSDVSLTAQYDDYASMLAGIELATSDPLGLGGLLTDAYRLLQLAREVPDEPALHLAGPLLAAAEAGLRAFAAENDLHAPAAYRLAFRELGLAIGLAAVVRAVREPRADGAVAATLARLERAAPLGAAIERFWSEPAQRASRSWREHEDIDDVMLATCLAPDGYLTLARRDARA